MFYNLQTQEGWISDNEILSSLELSEGGGMEVDNLNDSSPFALLPRAVQQSSMPSTNNMPSSNSMPSSNNMSSTMSSQLINTSSHSVIMQKQQQMCDYDSNNMNNTNDVIINRYNSMSADRHVIHYSDGTAVLESADHISRQNCVRTTTVSSAVGGVAANIPDFPDTEDLSAFLKNELFSTPRISPGYLDHPSPPLNQGGHMASTSPLHQSGVSNSVNGHQLPGMSCLTSGGLQEPHSGLHGMPSPSGSFEPIKRDRSYTWPRVLQAQGYGSNLMDTDTSEELLLLPEEVEPFNISSHQLPPFTSPSSTSGGTSSYLPLLSEEMPYEEKEDIVPDTSLASQGLKAKTTRRNPWGNYSYADLITQAIQSSPDKRLTLSQIYDWLINNVNYFKERSDVHTSAGWKNSIRHNLSLHNKFVKINNEGTGKSSWWTLMPEVGGAKPPRRRANSMESSKLKRERDRALKGVKARLERSSSTTSNGSSILEPTSPSPFFRGYEYRQRTNSTASTESGYTRIHTPSTPPPPLIASPPSNSSLLLPSSPPALMPYSPTASMSYSPPPPPTVGSGGLIDFNTFASIGRSDITDDLKNFDLNTMNIQPANIIRSIKEEKELEGGKMPKMTHKLTILEPRDTIPTRPALPPNSLHHPSSHSHELFKQTPVIMYNKQQMGGCGSGFNGFTTSSSSGAAVHMYSNMQQNGGHFHSTAGVKDWELVEQRDEDIAEILGLKTCNTVEREIERKEMINMKIAEMKSNLEKSESDAERKKTHSILQMLQEMAEKSEQDVKPTTIKDEIITDTADIDFSIFDGINLNTEDNSPEQPQQHQSPENPPLSKNVGNSKDDISTTAAPQPSANASATSLEDLAMTHFGQIMCL